MKILSFLIIIFYLFSNLSLCQLDTDDNQVVQFSVGRDDIAFKVVDYKNDKVKIYATIYSFDLEKTLAVTDINGIATIDKGVKGTLEISTFDHTRFCFKLNSDSIDSVVVRLKHQIDHLMSSTYPPLTDDSLKVMAEIDAKKDLNKGEIFLYFSTELTGDQIEYSRNHSFVFKEWKSGYSPYKRFYNEIVINYLSDKFGTDIGEELREVCWRND
jgi:hypothetical protein